MNLFPTDNYNHILFFIGFKANKIKFAFQSGQSHFFYLENFYNVSNNSIFHGTLLDQNTQNLLLKYPVSQIVALNKSNLEVKIILDNKSTSFQSELKRLIDSRSTGQSNSIENEAQGQEETSCFVYVMKDNHTRRIKIGISKDVSFREKTLLSQAPSIIVLASKKFKTRRAALLLESALHKRFEKQRKRGEWFLLGKEELIDLVDALS